MRISSPAPFALLAAAVVLAFASPAHADFIGYGAYVHGMVTPIFDPNCGYYGTNAGGSPNCLFNGTDPRFFSPGSNVGYQPVASAAGSLINSGGSITGAADLATGDLSLSLSTTGNTFHASVTAYMWDTLTFHFNDTAQHLVTVNMSGAVATSGGAAGNAGYLLALSHPADANVFPKYLTMDGFTWLQNGSYSASSSLLVHDGMTVNLRAGLFLFGGGTSSGLAFDPLVFNLNGGTFTSQSGVLLTQTPAAVPEPATLALLGTGLLVAAARRRRPWSRA